MDFKWTLSRPGIELEFETGSIKEAIGLLEQEGSSITEVFGFHMGNRAAPEAAVPAAPEEPKTRKPRAPKEAVAPPPLAIPTVPVQAAPTVTLPPNALNPAPAPAALAIPADGGIPPFLDRNAPPLAPLAPLPPPVPPVGVLGPKIVKALDEIQKGKDDGGQALSDWLAAAGLTQKGAKYDDACRAVLMISDEKLKGVAQALGVS